jgi:hypothetical protein
MPARAASGWWRVFQRGQDNAPAPVEFREGGFHTALFGARDRVSGYKETGNGTEGPACCLDDTTLGATGIRQHCVAGKMSADRPEYRFHRTKRHRHQHHVGTGNGAIGVKAVDDPQLNGQPQMLSAAA